MYWVFRFSALSLCFVLGGNAQAIDPMAPPGFREETRDLKKSPMDASEVRKKKRSGYVVQQITIRGKHRSAVINDQLVQEGDQLGKASVAKISKSNVVLKISGNRKVLEVQPDYPNVKTPSVIKHSSSQ